MRLSQQQLGSFRKTGHLTVPVVFTDWEIAAVLADLEAWSEEILNTLSDEERAWYLDDNAGGETLRKIDNPVYLRSSFARLAQAPRE